MEVWKPVVGFEGFYEVSNLGRVKSLWKREEKILTIFFNQNGYPSVSLSPPSLGKVHRVHKLVATAFNGPRPIGLECAHLDGDKTNNKADNLKWVTTIENMGHKKLHGTLLYGERHGSAKISEKAVLAMKEERVQGTSCLDLEKKYGLGESQIYNICSGRAWRHLT